jgi:hypothetical protein
MGGTVNVLPEQPLVLKIGDEVVLVDGISFELGLKYVQSPIRFDRREKFAFALAVQDCITNAVTAASQELACETTQLTTLIPSVQAPAQEAFVNGSVLKVILNSWFPFTEHQGLEAVPAPEILRVGTSDMTQGP